MGRSIRARWNEVTPLETVRSSHGCPSGNDKLQSLDRFQQSLGTKRRSPIAVAANAHRIARV
jgi:hypothetical protein